MYESQVFDAFSIPSCNFDININAGFWHNLFLFES